MDTSVIGPGEYPSTRRIVTEWLHSNVTWAEPLVDWLIERGYNVRESGQYNPATGRGWYSHPCELQRDHVRVRVNPGGVIILRDPGCTIQVSRPCGSGFEQWSPNSFRLDRGSYRFAERTREAIASYESRPAYTLAESQEQFGA